MTTKSMGHEEKLKKTQQKYRNLFENEVVGMYRSKLDGSALLEVNQALCDKLGYTREEMLSDPATIRWADPKAREKMVKLLNKDGMVRNYEADFVTKSGEIIHSLLSLKLYPQDSYIEGIAINITERKRAEETLRKVKDFNETLIQASPAFFVAISPEGKTIMMNEAMLQALGYSLDEVVGKDYLTTFVPESNWEMLAEVFQDLIQAKKPTLNENFLLTRDGRHILVEWQGRFVFKENDELDFFFGVGNDITERRQAEEELRRSEAKYRFLTENMNDIVWTADLDLNVTYYSPAVERVLGFNVNERMTLEAHRMLTPDSFARAVNALHAELGRDQDEGSDPGRSVKVELEYYHKNGSTVWMECVVTAIRDDSGKSIGIHGVSRDITDRRRAEEALRESEDRFRSLIQKSLDIIIVLDGNGVMTYETPSLESILGYQPGYLIGKSPFEFIHPDDLERVANDLNEVYLKTNPGVPTELRIRKADGTWGYLEALGQNLLEVPAINGIVITSRDITERKRVEDRLNNSEKRYRLLAENARDVIWVLDENLRYTFVSPSVKKLRGYTPEEVMNQTIDQVLTPGSYQVAMDIFVKELDFEKSGRGHHPDWSMTLELELICKDGSTVWTEVNISLIYDEAGNPTGILGLTRDIADRKQAEGELKKHRDHLEDLVRERTAKLIQANERLKQEIEESKRAKDALRVNEEIYRIHFSLSNDVMFTNDEEFRFLSVTPNVERVLGYKPKELIGRTFQDLNILHPDDMGRAFDNAKNVLSGGASRHPIYRFITKEGKTKFGEVSGVPLIKKGSGTTLISVARDVTERVEKEQALIETLDRYRTHFSLTDDVMFSFDHKLMVNSVSPNVEKVLGYKPEDLIGKPAHKLGVLSPEYIDEALDEAMHLLSGQTINSSIYEFITKDGKRKFGEFSSSPLKRDGSVVEVITVAREITHQIDHEKFLRESKETAHALLNACTDFMVLMDITGTIINMNKAASESLGRSVKELLGTCLFDHLPKEVANRRKIYLEQVISSGNPARFEDENRGRLFHSSWFPIYNELGKVTRIAIHTRDITELKQAFFKSKM